MRSLGGVKGGGGGSAGLEVWRWAKQWVTTAQNALRSCG